MNGVPVFEMKKMRAPAEDTRLVVVFQSEALAHVQPPEARLEASERGFFRNGDFGRSHVQTGDAFKETRVTMARLDSDVILFQDLWRTVNFVQHNDQADGCEQYEMRTEQPEHQRYQKIVGTHADAVEASGAIQVDGHVPG